MEVIQTREQKDVTCGNKDELRPSDSRIWTRVLARCDGTASKMPLMHLNLFPSNKALCYLDNPLPRPKILLLLVLQVVWIPQQFSSALFQDIMLCPNDFPRSQDHGTNSCPDKHKPREELSIEVDLTHLPSQFERNGFSDCILSLVPSFAVV